MSKDPLLAEVHVTIKMTRERIYDLLSCAIYSGGSAYWCVVQKVNGPAIVGGNHDDEPDYWNGGSVVFSANCDGSPYKHNGQSRFVLNDATIVSGLSLMATKCPTAFGNWLADNEDADTGDVFLQLCLFGEVVFG